MTNYLEESPCLMTHPGPDMFVVVDDEFDAVMSSFRRCPVIRPGRRSARRPSSSCGSASTPRRRRLTTSVDFTSCKTHRLLLLTVACCTLCDDSMTKPISLLLLITIINWRTGHFVEIVTENVTGNWHLTVRVHVRFQSANLRVSKSFGCGFSRVVYNDIEELITVLHVEHFFTSWELHFPSFFYIRHVNRILYCQRFFHVRL